jgi:Flp pilus assembly protein TadB
MKTCSNTLTQSGRAREMPSALIALGLVLMAAWLEVWVLLHLSVLLFWSLISLNLGIALWWIRSSRKRP